MKGTLEKKLIEKGLLFAFCEILIGIFCLIFKQEILQIAVMIAGIALIVVGLILLIQAKIERAKIEGIIRIAVGVVLIILDWAVTEIILYILAVLFIIYGVMNLINLIKIKSKDVVLFTRPILQLILGALLFFKGFDWLFIVIGILLIIEGAVEFVILLRRK